MQAQPHPNFIEVAQAAEELGFHSAWTAEAWGSDAFTPLTWIAAHTTKLKLGTSIVQISARTPASKPPPSRPTFRAGGRGEHSVTRASVWLGTALGGGSPTPFAHDPMEVLRGGSEVHDSMGTLGGDSDGDEDGIAAGEAEGTYRTGILYDDD